MDRRNVLKGLATLPFASALAGCDDKDKDDKKKDDKSRLNMLEIHLEGAFALVIQENKGNTLLAFSPRPKAGDEPHHFYVNGSRKPEDDGKSYRFKLAPDGLGRDEKPEVNPGLTDFYFKTDRWRVGDSLATLELPAPTKITFSGHRSPVTFQSDGRKAFMATNHVLKYELHRDVPPKLECSDPSLQCAPAPDSYPGVTRYFFEVGPKNVLDYNQSHAHAIKFFNYILQQSFPDLEKKYALAVDYGTEKRTQIPSRIVPAVFRYGAQTPEFQPASYVVDCEFTGPLVGTHTAPQTP